MTPSQALRFLPIYRKNLAAFEASGQTARAKIQRSLIKRLERDAKGEKK